MDFTVVGAAVEESDLSLLKTCKPFNMSITMTMRMTNTTTPIMIIILVFFHQYFFLIFLAVFWNWFDYKKRKKERIVIKIKCSRWKWTTSTLTELIRDLNADQTRFIYLHVNGDFYVIFMGKCVKDQIQCQGSYFPKQPAGQSADCTLNFFLPSAL